MPKRPLPVRRRTLQLIFALLVFTLSTTGVIQVTDDPAPAPAPPVTITYANPALTPAPDVDDHVAPDAGLPAAQSDDLPGVSEHVERAIANANENVQAGTYDTSGVPRGAAAKPARLTCLTPMNGGPRLLSSIKLGVIHVTVSRNVTGLLDGNALCSFFRSVKASPTWTVDNEGNSWLNVPLDRVPWTQAWFNRASCSIEFVGSTGRPGEGAAEWTLAQLAEGARLIAQCFQKVGIRPVRGAVNARGEILQAGVVTHEELGVKGGGHTDPGPRFDMTTFMALLRKATNQITSVDRVTCRKLNWWRTHGRRPGKPLANAIRRRNALAARGVRCTRTGPVRAT